MGMNNANEMTSAQVATLIRSLTDFVRSEGPTDSAEVHQGRGANAHLFFTLSFPYGGFVQVQTWNESFGEVPEAYTWGITPALVALGAL